MKLLCTAKRLVISFRAVPCRWETDAFIVTDFFAFADSAVKESLQDKILIRCEILKRTVHDILDSYKEMGKTRDRSECLKPEHIGVNGQLRGCFSD